VAQVSSSAWVWSANEVAHHNLLSLPSVVPRGGSRLTITIPEAIERYNHSAPPRIEIQTNSGPEDENAVMPYVPIHIPYNLTPPEVPNVDWVSPGNGAVTLAWALPEAGGKVDTYRIQPFSGDTIVNTQEVTGLFDQVTVPGLINGQPYSFDVTV